MLRFQEKNVSSAHGSSGSVSGEVSSLTGHIFLPIRQIFWHVISQEGGGFDVSPGMTVGENGINPSRRCKKKNG